MQENAPKPAQTSPHEWAPTYPYPAPLANLFSEGEFKWIFRNRKINGFDKAIRKIHCRKFLVHIPTAMQWVEDQRD